MHLIHSFLWKLPILLTPASRSLSSSPHLWGLLIWTPLWPLPPQLPHGSAPTPGPCFPKSASAPCGLSLLSGHFLAHSSFRAPAPPLPTLSMRQFGSRVSLAPHWAAQGPIAFPAGAGQLAPSAVPVLSAAQARHLRLWPFSCPRSRHRVSPVSLPPLSSLRPCSQLPRSQL